jgi:ADP-heptose:LPS heptosyltransferase
LDLYTNNNINLKIKDWLQSNHLEDKNIIVVHPMVANYGLATKKWKNSNFFEVIKTLLLNKKNHILITGSPNERELCTDFLNQLGIYDNVLLCAGDFSIKELFTLLTFCHLSISCDTSIFHLAIAAKIPTIGIFGATNSNKIAPKELPHVKAFHANISCWPCHKNKDFSPYWPKCKFNEAKCLEETKATDIIDYISNHYPSLLRNEV